MLKNKVLLLAAFCFVGASFCSNNDEETPTRVQQMKDKFYSAYKSPLVLPAAGLIVSAGVNILMSAKDYTLDKDSPYWQSAFNYSRRLPHMPYYLVCFLPKVGSSLADKALLLKIVPAAAGYAASSFLPASGTDLGRVSRFLAAVVGSRISLAASK